jgi:hypothetical protein
MRRKTKVSETIEALSKLKDCPEELVKLANTNFEKACVIELIEFSKKMEGLKKDISWLKYLVKAIFTVTIVSVVAQILLKVI